MAINYFFEDVKTFKLSRRSISKWIKSCIGHYNKRVGDINFIFCSDVYLKEINIQYLKHDYFTDIITFDNNEEGIISGDIYISTERVLDNSKLFEVEFEKELLRVMVHGILHLNGFEDTSDDQRAEMHRLEDFWLDKFYSVS
jgi:probable rRNA maturation factor